MAVFAPLGRAKSRANTALPATIGRADFVPANHRLLKFVISIVFRFVDHRERTRAMFSSGLRITPEYLVTDPARTRALSTQALGWRDCPRIRL